MVINPAFLKHWHDCVRKYGEPIYYAAGPTGTPVTPTNVDHLFSNVFEMGTRVYAFRDTATRDAFIRRIGGVACDNPYPETADGQ